MRLFRRLLTLLPFAALPAFAQNYDQMGIHLLYQKSTPITDPRASALQNWNPSFAGLGIKKNWDLGSNGNSIFRLMLEVAMSTKSPAGGGKGKLELFTVGGDYLLFPFGQATGPYLGGGAGIYGSTIFTTTTGLITTSGGFFHGTCQAPNQLVPVGIVGWQFTRHFGLEARYMVLKFQEQGTVLQPNPTTVDSLDTTFAIYQRQVVGALIFNF